MMYENFEVCRNAKGYLCAIYFGAWDKAEHDDARAKAEKLGVKIFFGYDFKKTDAGIWINGVQHYLGGDGKYYKCN